MKRNFLLIVTLLMLTSTLFSQTKSESADDYYLDALEYYQLDERLKAKELFEKVISLDPNHDAAHFYLGILGIDDMSKASAEDIKYCEEHLKSAIQLDSTNYWYKYFLASFYQATDRNELTIKLFEEMIEQFPKKSSLYFEAINIYLSENDVTKAIETLDKIEKISGKSEIIGVTGTELRLKSEGTEAAFKYLEEFYKECATPRLATMLGDYYAQSFNDSLAIDYYNRAIDMDPDYITAYLQRGSTYFAIRDYDNFFNDIIKFVSNPDVMPQFRSSYIMELLGHQQFTMAFLPQMDSLVRSAYNVNPKDSIMSEIASNFYYQTGQTDEAFEVLKQNMENHPESFNAKFSCLLAYYSAGDWDNTMNLVSDMIVDYPRKVDLHQIKGIAHWQREEYDSAVDSYLNMLSIKPKDSATVVIANNALGDLYHTLGDTKKAFNCYEKVLKIDPENLSVLNNYAYYLSLQEKKLKKAYKMSKKTIEAEPSNATYLDTYGWILYLMGRHIESKAIFKQAMIYGGKESSVILDHYAEVLYALEEYDLAFIYWDQAMLKDDSQELRERVKLRKANKKK